MRKNNKREFPRVLILAMVAGGLFAVSGTLIEAFLTIMRIPISMPSEFHWVFFEGAKIGALMAASIISFFVVIAKLLEVVNG